MGIQQDPGVANRPGEREGGVEVGGIRVSASERKEEIAAMGRVEGHEPCGLCGVRGDVGCRHLRRLQRSWGAFASQQPTAG